VLTIDQQRAGSSEWDLCHSDELFDIAGRDRRIE
jgi:hypothetical protein